MRRTFSPSFLLRQPLLPSSKRFDDLCESCAADLERAGVGVAQHQVSFARVVALVVVCTESLIRIDCATESPKRQRR
jgi:hypothetical protein